MQKAANQGFFKKINYLLLSGKGIKKQISFKKVETWHLLISW